MATSAGGPPTPGWAAHPNADRRVAQFEQSHEAMVAKIPQTAAEAVEASHREFALANACAKESAKHPLRWWKRRELQQLALVSLGAAQWLHAEAARLRSIEQATPSFPGAPRPFPGPPTAGRPQY